MLGKYCTSKVVPSPQLHPVFIRANVIERASPGGVDFSTHGLATCILCATHSQAAMEQLPLLRLPGKATKVFNSPVISSLRRLNLKVVLPCFPESHCSANFQ